jgi:hypothetical protein
MIAICITGQYRSWDRVRNNILENIIKDDADIFYVCDKDLSITNTDYEITEGLQTFYDESVLQLFGTRKANETKVENTINMFYKIMKCNQLKLQHEIKHNFKYDTVVRLRTDMPFERLVTFSKDADKIFIPKNVNYGGVCDRFAYGPSHLMDKFCDVFPNIKQYFDEGCRFHPETLQGYHCKKIGLKLGLNIVEQDISILPKK